MVRWLGQVGDQTLSFIGFFNITWDQDIVGMDLGFEVLNTAHVVLSVNMWYLSSNISSMFTRKRIYGNEKPMDGMGYVDKPI